MAARITQPLVKVFADVPVPIERDHAGAVDHLRSDDHVAGTLHDLKVVVVDDRHVGWHISPNDTAYWQVEIQVRVRHSGVEAAQGGGTLVTLLLPLGRNGHERRNPPIGRVHDERGAMVRSYLEAAGIHPVFVIGAVDVDFRTAVTAIAAQVAGKLVLKLFGLPLAEDVFACDSSRTLE